MPRRNWLLLMIGVVGVIPTSLFCLPHAAEHPWFLAGPGIFCLLILGSTAGWSIWNAVRARRIRRVGVSVIGRVVHARQSGSSNRVPTWQVEAELPDGGTTRLIVDRYAPFFPGEPIELVVDPKHPGHAAQPQVSSDF